MPTNLDIQSVDPESVGFVHRLLAQAITRGHEGLGFQVRAEDLERHVREFYDFMSPGAEVKALVGLLGSEMVGHITWFPEAEDIVTGERYFEIVDVFVIEKYRDRGYSGALTAAVERYASEVEGTLLGNVSRESDASDDRLYQALHRGGWIPKFDIWVSRRRG